MKALIIGLIFAIAGVFVMAPAAVSANVLPNNSGVCNGAAKNSTICKTKPVKKGENPVIGLIVKVTRLIAIIAGIAAVIMIIISGIRFISSGGDSQKVAGARKNLFGVVIGLAIIALAGVIISFVVSRL